VFDALSTRLGGVFRSLRGQGTLSVADVEQASREIRLALLEADVNFKVVKQIVDRVKERATGQEVLKSLSPDQAVLRVVRDEMVEVLGGGPAAEIARASRPPSVVLMTGLQGSGKTTTTAKLGRWLGGRGHHPLLVSTDVYRPAAREQLLLVGQQAGQKVHHPAALSEPAAILESALAEARAVGHDFVLVDTAGRLHVDDELMAELGRLKELANPSEILYVADAMTGQDAVESAFEFHRRIGITGNHARHLGRLIQELDGLDSVLVAYNYTPETRPNFVAPIYLAYDWTIKGNVPSDAPPMFILAATDDPLGLAPQSIALYEHWTAAKKPAELHLYSKGGHGFGMRKQNLPADRWIERFTDWLEAQRLLKK
jgi:Ni2+-binding GTPase involved in maturation of urease and hydrogenase